jgi:enamine deaminase RidA (YjgF/YER057c/UK114 family)
MSDSIQSRLQSLGITLPEAAAPAANYLPFMRSGNQLFVSGQLPLGPDGLTHTGKLGSNISVEDGQKAARQCAINILAQAKAALDGDLERISQLVRITGFVAGAPGFTEHHLVVNGASDLFAAVLGARGQHARAAVGVAALPLDAAVEVDAIIDVG